MQSAEALADLCWVADIVGRFLPRRKSLVIWSQPALLSLALAKASPFLVALVVVEPLTSLASCRAFEPTQGCADSVAGAA